MAGAFPLTAPNFRARLVLFFLPDEVPWKNGMRKRLG
jgi:hypothetical protein